MYKEYCKCQLPLLTAHPSPQSRLPTPPCPITSPDHWGPHGRPLPPRRWSQPHEALLLTPPAGIFLLSGLSSVQVGLLRLRFSSLNVSGFGPQEGRRPGAQTSSHDPSNSTHSERGQSGRPWGAKGLCPLEEPRTPTPQGGAEGRTGAHREAGCRGPTAFLQHASALHLPASWRKRPHTRPCAGRRRGPAKGGAEPGGAGARPASDSARAAHLVYKGVRPQSPQHRRLVGKFAAVQAVCATTGAHRQTSS